MLLISFPAVSYALFVLGRQRFAFSKIIAAVLLYLLVPIGLSAETISGTVLDPSGAVVSGARIEISGEGLAEPIVLSSDGQGKFTSPELKAGIYTVQVEREGFETLTKNVDLKGAVALQLTLA